MQEVTSSDIDQFVQGGSLTVVDCYAPWCAPCRVLKPKLESISKDFEDVLFLTLNIDEAPDFVKAHRIRSIPTLLFFKSGSVVHTMVGVPSEKLLEEKIEAYRK